MNVVEKKIQSQDGYTMTELIIVLAIISIFYTALSAGVANASKLYIQETISNNDESTLMTVMDDIANNITHGLEPVVFQRVYNAPGKGIVMEEIDMQPTLANPLSSSSVSMAEGIVYVDENVGAVYLAGDDSRGDYQIIDVTSVVKTQASALGAADADAYVATFIQDFEGDGVDLQTVAISLAEDKNRIEGLSYSTSYFERMDDLDLEIKKINDATSVFDGTYRIRLSGNGLLEEISYEKTVRCLNSK